MLGTQHHSYFGARNKSHINISLPCVTIDRVNMLFYSCICRRTVAKDSSTTKRLHDICQRTPASVSSDVFLGYEQPDQYKVRLLKLFVYYFKSEAIAGSKTFSFYPPMENVIDNFCLLKIIIIF